MVFGKFEMADRSKRAIPHMFSSYLISFFPNIPHQKECTNQLKESFQRHSSPRPRRANMSPEQVSASLFASNMNTYKQEQSYAFFNDAEGDVSCFSLSYTHAPLSFHLFQHEPPCARRTPHAIMPPFFSTPITRLATSLTHALHLCP